MKKFSNWPLRAATVLTVLLAAIILLLAVDQISSAIESYGYWRLSSKASSELVETRTEAKFQRDRAETLTKQLLTLRGKSYPDLLSFKQLVGEHRLQITAVERVLSHSKSRTTDQEYSIIVKGRIGRLTELLKSLEDQFLLETRLLRLTPAADDGRTINMLLTLKVIQS